MRRFYKSYAHEIWFTLALGAAVLVMYFSGAGCLFKLLTGFDCMTCGMTRACISALRLDFKSAFYYHPLFWTVPIIYLVLFFRKKFSDRFLIIFCICTVVCYVAVYISRLLFLPGSLIYFNI